jgi:uncharacterized protein DUF4062/tetratricopeptide repeat protein
VAKVYVSSTLADLERERQAVLEWLRAARHQAVDSYLPDSDTVRDSCLDDVGTSDLYVLILGHRYGFQPDQDDPESPSITHLEFRRAGQSGIPRIALLRTSIPDISLSDVTDPRRLALVTAFRDEVAREVRPAQFSDLQDLIKGLSTGVQAELAKLDRAAAEQGRRRPANTAGPVLRLAPRPAFLAGREGLLAELDTRLDGTGRTGPRVAALYGLGGAGKTSVALEYAYRHLAGVGVAWQLAAEDAAVLAAGFGELAAQLGTLADERDPVASVHGALAASRAEWLLVFDNAPDRASVEAFLPPAGPGRVLITSRNLNWPPAQAVDVPVLETEVAAAFLVTRTGDGDRLAAAGLAAELGGLPLALEQAAAYIGATGGSLARYLESFRRRRESLLARGAPTGHAKTVATTWSLAFTRLEQTAPQAVGLLRLLACCAPEPVPIRLLLRPVPGLAAGLGADVATVLASLLEDDLAVDDAVAALGRFSLVIPAGNGLLTVHRLVQVVTLAPVSADVADQWRQAAAALVEAAIPADPDLTASWPAFAALLPHARAVLALTSEGMRRMAEYLGKSGGYGSFSAARDLCRLIADAYAADDAFGAEHLRTLAARANLAYWTGRAGDRTGARDQFAALLPLEERVLGPEHQQTLGDRGGLAMWTGEAGDESGARDQLTALLSVQQRVLGPEHPDTVDTQQNLARWTGRAGDPARARDQLAGVLSIRARINGPDHMDTLTTRRDLARWTGETGDAAGARDQFAALLRDRERALGPDHPDTLTTRYELAKWTGRAGDRAAAREQLATLLLTEERIMGREHSWTRSVQDRLAQLAEPAAGAGL